MDFSTARFFSGGEFAGAGELNPSLCAQLNRLKTLHKYLAGQVLAATLLTVAVFTVVLLVGNGLQQMLTLLVSGHVSFGIMVKAFIYLIPFVWMFALPMGLLTATLLVFGRFSADQELTAARASGVSLLSLVTPVLLLSLLGCGLSAWFNTEIGPRSRVAYIRLTGELKSELMKNVQLPEGRFVRDFPGYIFYVGKNNGGNLEDVMIYVLRNETNVQTTIRAERGKMLTENGATQLVLQLFDARSVSTGSHAIINSSPTMTMNFSPTVVTNRPFEPKISDMTFGQLRKKLAELESVSLPVAGSNSPAELRDQLAAMRKQQQDFTEPVRVEMHRQVAFSFACFGFTLVGIPLGIRVHRRETNIGVALALGLVVVYYAFIMLGESLSSRPEFYPHLILWLPNFIFQAVGAVLLWRANRGI